MDNLEIITTSDGSHTLRNRSLNETYHSVHGAVQESMHVFVRHGLQYFWEQHNGRSVSVLEVGFGTGLNALLTLRFAAEKAVDIRYTTIEPFPLAEVVWSGLNYGAEFKDREQFAGLHAAGWEHETQLTPQFTLLKHRISLQDVRLAEHYDVIYFDAFAPSVQPELWALSSLEKVVAGMRSGGVFVTYSARGQLKRDLRSLGLEVETLPGPPGKNEMVQGKRV